MGPLSAKSYPGRDLVRPQPPPAGRARQEIDYGRRGKGYVFGAFCPATGAALEFRAQWPEDLRKALRLVAGREVVAHPDPLGYLLFFNRDG